MKRRRNHNAVEVDPNDISVGARVSLNQKGLLVEGETYVWDVYAPTGSPHHDDAMAALDFWDKRWVQLSFLKKAGISFDGLFEPIESTHDVLRYFDGYTDDTDIYIDTENPHTDLIFRFKGNVRGFKQLMRSSPPPYAGDYEDGDEDSEYVEDYTTWVKAVASGLKPKYIRDILGRGGPEDVWQPVTVYNPGRKRR